MSELQGQMDIETIVAGKVPEAGIPEGCVAQGHLTNPDAASARRLDVLAGEINLLEESAKDVFRRTAMEIGRRLCEARNLVPRGRWGEWLETQIKYSARKAQQLMQVYEEYQGRELTAAYDALSFTQLYDLLAAPVEERDALAEKAAAEELSTRELKREIEALRADKEAANIKIYDLIQQGEAAERRLKAVEEVNQSLKDEKAKAERKAELSALRADDAVGRANQLAKDLSETGQRLRELENREPEVVEVVPEDARREMEAMQAQLKKALDDVERLSGQVDAAAQARAKRVLAAQLQARIAMKHIEAETEALSAAIAGVEMLEKDKAVAMREEVRALAARLFKAHMEVS